MRLSSLLPPLSVDLSVPPLWLPFHCDLLPTNDLLTNTLPPVLSSFPATAAFSSSPPSPLHPCYSLTTSPLLLASALQELKEFSWDQVRSRAPLPPPRRDLMMIIARHALPPADPGLRRHESRVGGQRLDHLTKKELRGQLKMVDSFHRSDHSSSSCC